MKSDFIQSWWLEKEKGHNATLQVLPNHGTYITDCNTNIFPWDSLFPGVSYCDGGGESTLICRIKICTGNAEGSLCLYSFIENCAEHSRNPYLGHNVTITSCSSTSWPTWSIGTGTHLSEKRSRMYIISISVIIMCSIYKINAHRRELERESKTEI